MAYVGTSHQQHDATHRGRRRRSFWHLPVVVAVALSLVAAGGGVASAKGRASTKIAAGVHKGGSLTVLESAAYIGDYPEGLDPATNMNTLLGNASLLDAIFGKLFEVGANNKVIPDLAAGYSLANGNKQLTLHLRPGVVFSDGTPFDAAAVIFNLKRDLNEQDPANPPWPKYTSITAPNAHTVVIDFSAPDGAAVTQMLNTTISWIVSPTALKKLGEQKFKNFPVGAGPFEVVSDTPSTKLVLKKNPHYWQKGHPYLDKLTFQTVSNDETALEDLKAGNGQAYEDMSTPQLVTGFKSAGYTVTTDPGSGVVDIELENGVAPFTNIKAREALYYALDAAAFGKKLFDGTCAPSESFTGPGGLFYMPKVPGYRTYDLAKAKALVKQLGGLSFTMYYGGLGLGPQEAPAVQTMLQDAGMHVTIKEMPTLSIAVAEFNTHKWPAILWGLGSYDPSGGTGVAFFLDSHGPFTGIHDPTVDKYINQGAVSSSPKARAAAYLHLAEYLNKEAYVPILCSPSSWDITVKGVRGPGLTTAYGSFGEGPLVQWQNVSTSNG